MGTSRSEVWKENVRGRHTSGKGYRQHGLDVACRLLRGAFGFRPSFPLGRGNSFASFSAQRSFLPEFHGPARRVPIVHMSRKQVPDPVKTVYLSVQFRDYLTYFHTQVL